MENEEGRIFNIEFKFCTVRYPAKCENRATIQGCFNNNTKQYTTSKFDVCTSEANGCPYAKNVNTTVVLKDIREIGYR